MGILRDAVLLLRNECDIELSIADTVTVTSSTVSEYLSEKGDTGIYWYKRIKILLQFRGEELLCMLRSKGEVVELNDITAQHYDVICEMTHSSDDFWYDNNGTLTGCMDCGKNTCCTNTVCGTAVTHPQLLQLTHNVKGENKPRGANGLLISPCKCTLPHLILQLLKPGFTLRCSFFHQIETKRDDNIKEEKGGVRSAKIKTPYEIYNNICRREKHCCLYSGCKITYSTTNNRGIDFHYVGSKYGIDVTFFGMGQKYILLSVQRPTDYPK